jgi:hypothetical protein
MTAMQPKWTKEQIREARKIELEPILNRRGLRLRPLKNGNTLVEDYPDLVVKQHYWTWPDKNMAGNTIDFFVKIEGKSFNQAMEIITCPAPRETEGQLCGQKMPNPVASPGQIMTAAGTINDNSAGIAQKCKRPLAHPLAGGDIAG